jgi:ATP-binding cassette, subfamily B, bacterial
LAGSSALAPKLRGDHGSQPLAPRLSGTFGFQDMLTKTPPPALAAKLSELGIAAGDLIIFTDTDIDRHGRYVSQWLAITATRLVVLSDGDQPLVLHDVQLNEAKEYRSEAVIGSGLLQARIDNVWVDLLRYSNRLADRFGKIGRKLERFLHGEAIVVHPEENEDKREADKELKKVNKSAVITRMAKLMIPYRGYAILMMSLLLVGICLDLVMPRLTAYMVDKVLPGNAQSSASIMTDPVRHVQMLLWVVAIVAGVQVSRMLVNLVNGRVSSIVGTHITFDMRNRLVNHMLQLSVGYYDRQQAGSLVGRVAYDTNALQGFITQLTGGFMFQLLMLVGVAIMMFTISPKLAFFAVLTAPLVITGNILFWRYVYPLYFRSWESSSKQAGMLSGLWSGIRVVKAFAREDEEESRFNKTSADLRKASMSVDKGTQSFSAIMALVFQLGGWLVWYFGGREVIHGVSHPEENPLTLGQLMGFFGYLGMFYGPLGSISQFTNWLTQFATQAHRIFEVLDTPVQIAEPENPIPLKTVKGDIKFSEVSFGYTKHQPIIRDISFDIKPGEFIGVVGRSGSGKTTLINLICRFYDVDEGVVKIDNIDVRSIPKADLRSKIGVVLQEPFLFRGSIWENLGYGISNPAPEKVIASSKAAFCHDFILRTAHGYDTWVGERGAGLSGGERQRVSIGRVLLTDPKILILDEATSSVDAESEAAIQAALAELVAGRTTIAIAHRLSTLRRANRIMVVDLGKIAEYGNHDELMAKDGIYTRLVKLQGHSQVPTVDQTLDKAKDEEALKKAEANLEPASHHIRWLLPESTELSLSERGAMVVKLTNGKTFGGVWAIRCLPVTSPNEFVSLRCLNEEKRDIEVGIIRQLDAWPKAARDLIEESLLTRNLVHRIKEITSIEQHNALLRFKVETDLGAREFLMRLQYDRAQQHGPRGRIILDIDENRYLIEDMDEMSERDRRLFMRFIYW